MKNEKLEKGFWKNNGVKPTDKCISCEETFRKIVKEYGKYAVLDGNYSNKKGGFVCHPCWEASQDRPQGTVLIYSPKQSQVEKVIVGEHEDLSQFAHVNRGGDLEKLDFGDYDSEEECPIQFKYVHTDAWRGYYEPVGEGWKVLHSDCILSYSEDSEQLKEFDTDIKKQLWELGYEFAVAYGTTSNLFSCGYDVLIKTGQEKDILKEIALYAQLTQLAIKYRDPARFNRTALTGSDEKTKESELLVKAWKKLNAGEDFEAVKEDILREAKQTA